MGFSENNVNYFEGGAIVQKVYQTPLVYNPIEILFFFMDQKSSNMNFELKAEATSSVRSIQKSVDISKLLPSRPLHSQQPETITGTPGLCTTQASSESRLSSLMVHIP